MSLKHGRRAAGARTIRLGRSTCGRAIVATVYGAAAGGAEPVVFIGGVHGDEPKSVSVAKALIEQFTIEPPGSLIAVLPVANPDGVMERTRGNARGVDINRNFPTGDWSPQYRLKRYHPGRRPASEPETRAIIKLIESLRPGLIVTIHSINKNRFCNNYDGPARSIARRFAARNGYPVTSSIGYPTPGSFGAWAGRERKIPVITLELPSHHSAKRCWLDNRDALIDCASGRRTPRYTE